MTTPTLKKHDLSELEQLYLDGEQVDSEIFTEMRNNLLLIAGEHYSKRKSEFHKRLQKASDVSEQVKLRLTKNHIQKINKQIVNHITTLAPGVGFKPANENELSDQKSAEMHHAVWKSGKETQNLDELIDDWGEDFGGIGEVATKLFFDPHAGPITSYQQKIVDGVPMFMDPQGQETGDPGIDPATGQPTHKPAQGEPVHQGEIQFEEVHGFNLLRDPSARSMQKSPYLIIRKMAQTKELAKRWPDQAGKIKESTDETLVVFDSARGGYHKSRGQTMVKEYYFRPCAQYPEGYFFITVREAILAEGPLPGGIFPIEIQAFDKIQTTPRGRSLIKHMRPYQAEINRAASKMAEHQITLGDDKLVVRNGSKVTEGASLPGVRTVTVTGSDPVVMEGRSGAQYLEYMQSQIDELYKVMNIPEELDEMKGQMDAYAMLMRAASQKRRFNKYVKRFERFLIKVTKTYLRLSKFYLPDEAIIYMVGKREAINIAEFKNSDDLCYQIHIEAQSDDIESKMGQQLSINHIIQYTGTKMEKEDIGKFIRLMPYANVEEGMSDLTTDYDNATNDILALDRGQRPMVNEYDNHVYVTKRLTARMRQNDFQTLAPEIQESYKLKVKLHMMMQAEQVKQVQMATAGIIPTTGYLVKMDFYETDPASPTGKSKRIEVPADSIRWMIEKLRTQGTVIEPMEGLPEGAKAQIAQMATPQIPTPSTNGMALVGNQGAGMPGGVANGTAGNPGPGTQH